jgi:hypothetical protein
MNGVVRLIGVKTVHTSRPVPEDDDTMRAIVQDRYGPAERWRLTEIDLPGLAGSEVLVKVHTRG